MFVLRLNLLPTRKKDRINDLVKFLFLKHLAEIVLFFLCLAGSTFLLGLYILEDNFNNLASNLVAVNQENLQATREATKINERISQIHSAQEEFVPWSQIFKDVTETTNKRVRWERWQFNQKEGTAALTGIGQDRDAVLILEEDLKKLSWVAKVSIPLADLVAIHDKPFTVTAILDLKKLTTSESP